MLLATVLATSELHRAFVGLTTQSRSRHHQHRAAAADGGKKEVVYNYFSQDYALVTKQENNFFAQLIDQASDVLSPWTQAEKDALALLEEVRPNWRTSPFTPDNEVQVRRRFRTIVTAAGSEEVALEVLQKNLAVLCFGPGQVQRAAEVLVAGLGREKATEVIRKNPGVLTIDPAQIEGNLPAITIAADAINLVVNNGGAARILAGVIGLAVAVSLAKALLDVYKIRALGISP